MNDEKRKRTRKKKRVKYISYTYILYASNFILILLFFVYYINAIQFTSNINFAIQLDGSKANERDEDGNTALHRAAKVYKRDLFLFLLLVPLMLFCLLVIVRCMQVSCCDEQRDPHGWKYLKGQFTHQTYGLYCQQIVP